MLPIFYFQINLSSQKVLQYVLINYSRSFADYRKYLDITTSNEYSGYHINRFDSTV